MDFQGHSALPSSSTDRSFGAVMAAFFLIVGLMPLLVHGTPRFWAFVVAAALGATAVLAPFLLSGPNRLWMRLGALLHAIVSPIALGTAFFAVVLPLGLLMRVFGKQPLALDFEAKIQTYWITRDPPGPDPQSFTNQF